MVERTHPSRKRNGKARQSERLSRVDIKDCLHDEIATRVDFERIGVLNDIHKIILGLTNDVINADDKERIAVNPALLDAPTYTYTTAMVEQIPPHTKIDAYIIGDLDFDSGPAQVDTKILAEGDDIAHKLNAFEQDTLMKRFATHLSLTVNIPQIKMNDHGDGTADFKQSKKSGDYIHSFDYCGRRFIFDFDAVTDPSGSDTVTAGIISTVVKKLQSKEGIQALNQYFGTTSEDLTEEALERFLLEYLNPSMMLAVKDINKTRHPPLTARATGAVVIKDNKKSIATCWGDTEVAHITSMDIGKREAQASVLSHPTAHIWDGATIGGKQAGTLTGNGTNASEANRYIIESYSEKFKGDRAGTIGSFGSKEFSIHQLTSTTFDTGQGGDLFIYSDGLRALARFSEIRTPWLLAKFMAENYWGLLNMGLKSKTEDSKYKMGIHQAPYGVQITRMLRGFWPDDLEPRSKIDDVSFAAEMSDGPKLSDMHTGTEHLVNSADFLSRETVVENRWNRLFMSFISHQLDQNYLAK